MAVFLTTFLLIYSSLHIYFFVKAKGAIQLNALSAACLIIFLVIMIIAPIAVRILERSGWENLARFMAYVGYTWMSVLFIFFALSILFDFFCLVGHTGNMAFFASLPGLSSRFVFFFTLLVSFCVNTYGYFEAQNPKTEKMTIESAAIPEKIGRIRIVQISDVHIGIIVRGKRLKKIVDKVTETRPDILVSTGNLLDGQINNLAESTLLLRNIRPRYGKFAITGNHEFYAGIHESTVFTRNSGFSFLRNKGTIAAGVINIIGIDDTVWNGNSFSYINAEVQLLNRFPRENYTILLKHRPIVNSNAAGLFNIQLSGHTHKGQIFPFSLITRIWFPHHAGHFMTTKKSHLYVSRGTGTWGPPIRLLALPEITVIDLVHKKK